jgi:AmmeMemoRadiSam system protein A
MKELLRLARESIIAHLEGKKAEVSKEIKEKYKDKKACFVTLTKDGGLRGCIGSLEARQELWKDVVDNAVNAGFHDPRFPELDKDELEDVKIEVSVLSKPEKLEHKDAEDLLRKLDKDMGIVLKKGFHSATFLPQVWEQLPDKKMFLERLCMKAGLFKDDWKDADISFYRVEKVGE